MALFGKGRVKKFTSLVENKPQEIDAILDLAKKLLEDGEHDLVAARLEELAPTVEDEQKRGEVLLRVANIRKGQGDFEGAIELLGQAINLPGTEQQRSLRHYLLGTCQMEAAKLHSGDAAEDLYNLAADNFAHAEEHGASERLKKHLNLNRGYALFYTGQFDQARGALVRAAKSFAQDDLPDADWVKVFTMLAEIAAPKSLDNAVKLCKKALQFAHDDLDRGRINLTLGRLMQESRPQEAAEKLETAARYLKSYPEATDEQVSLALELPRAYLKRNLVREAIVEAEQALKERQLPDRGLYLIRDLLSDAYQREGRLEDAILHRYQAVSLAPNSERRAYSLFRLGLLQLEAGEHEAACTSLEDAQESGMLAPGSFAESQLALAQGYVNLERGDDAVKLLTHVLNLGYDAERTTRARELLAEAYIVREQWLKAAEMLKELAFLETFPDVAQAAKDRITGLRVELEAGNIGALLSKADRTALQMVFAEALGEKSLFERLRVGLAKTRSNLVGRLDSLVKGYSEIDDDLLEELEEILITSDLGVETTMMIMKHLHKQVAQGKLSEPKDLVPYIKGELEKILLEHGDVHLDVKQQRPFVLMVVGVNGVGKTTTIAKLARRYTQQGLKVLLVAGDTFRAGAIEQLGIWAERVGCDIVKSKEGADPSSVVYDGMEKAKELDVDLVIVDTAGRLHTKVNLMEELKKVRRVAEKKLEGAPHETLLVLDSTNGQNAISQAKTFNEAIHVDGIALTKLDGTAKGGIVVTISHELKIPVKLIGIGEKMDDLRDFIPTDFVQALFATEPEPETFVSTKAEPDAEG